MRSLAEHRLTDTADDDFLGRAVDALDMAESYAVNEPVDYAAAAAWAAIAEALAAIASASVTTSVTVNATDDTDAAT